MVSLISQLHFSVCLEMHHMSLSSTGCFITHFTSGLTMFDAFPDDRSMEPSYCGKSATSQDADIDIVPE